MTAVEEPNSSEQHSAPPADRAEEQEKELTLPQMIASVLAAAFGVQSSRNRERDFSRGKPLHFIALGIVFTVLFVLAVVTVVNLVLGSV